MSSHSRSRVLIVLPTGGVYGGMEAFSIEIARQLSEDARFDVRLVMRLRRGWIADPTFVDFLKTLPIETVFLGSISVGMLKHIVWADLVNCHFPILDVMYPASLLRKHIVLSVENRRLPQHHFFHRAAHQMAKYRWYISEFVARTWGEDTEVSSEFLRVVPAVCELELKPQHTAERKGFLFIGRWVDNKGILELIDSYYAAQISHEENPMTLVGDGPLAPEIHLKIQSSRLGKFITTPGFINQDAKTHLLSTCKWNVAPAQFEEDLGLTPIEARGVATPSIVTNIGGLPEAAGEAAILCDPFSIESLTHAIEQAASMSADNYAERCKTAFDSLSNYLPSADFYRKEFAAILGVRTC